MDRIWRITWHNYIFGIGGTLKGRIESRDYAESVSHILDAQAPYVGYGVISSKNKFANRKSNIATIFSFILGYILFLVVFVALMACLSYLFPDVLSVRHAFSKQNDMALIFTVGMLCGMCGVISLGVITSDIASRILDRLTKNKFHACDEKRFDQRQTYANTETQQHG